MSQNLHQGRRSRRAMISTVSGLVVAQVLSGAALAQSDDVIVVTAQKREQNVNDVGITLTALSGEELEKAGIDTAPEVALMTPGVGLSGSYGGNSLSFSIRGVTQQDFQLHSEGPNAIYVDEAYLASNNAAGVGLFDIERVEVLKGPQGTLFGRNATGGLVSFVTRKPTEEFEARATASYGSYNDFKAEAAVGGPIANNIQGRIAGLYQRNDGWVENVNPSGEDLGGRETLGVRVHLAAQPFDNVDVLATGLYNNTDLSWGPYLTYVTNSVLNADGTPNSLEAPGGLNFFGSPGSNIDDLIINSNQAQGVDSGNYFRVGAGTLRVNVDLGWADLTSISNFTRTTMHLSLDNDAGPEDTVTSDGIGRITNWSEELRLYKDFGRARLTSGFYYLNIEAEELQELIILYGPLGDVITDTPQSQKTDSYSLFSQVEYDLSNQLTLVGGVRATREEKEFGYVATVEPLDGSFPVTPVRSIAQSSGDWLFSGKAQIEYRPNANSLFYLGYNRGVKAGGFNAPFAGGATPVDAEVPYVAEKLNAYELGAKLSLADNRAQVNGAIFYYDYKDYQSFKFQNFATVVTNLPAEIFGAEVDVLARPFEGAELQVGASYVDAEINSVLVSNALGAATLERRPPFTSKWEVFARASQRFPLADGFVTLQSDIQYSSDFFFSVTNFDSTVSESHVLIGARAAWLSPNERFEIAVFGKNLTDDRYRTVGFDVSDFAGYTQAAYNKPRWFGGSISVRF